MTITTTSVISAPVQQSFSYKLLSVPVPNMIHNIPADLKIMPRNGGTTLRMRRYNPLPTAVVPLGNSGVPPAAVTTTVVDIDATMSFYGQYIILNEQVTLQNQDPVLNELTERLGVSLRQTEDQLTRDMLTSTASFINCTAGGNGDNPTELTGPDVLDTVRALRGANAYSFLSGIEGELRFGTAPVRDAFFVLGHTDQIGIIDNISSFIQKWNYPNQNSTLYAEYGAVFNSRFLLSSIGSITPNASALGANVYNNFFCGRESYAVIEQDGYSAQFVYRPPMYSDPLAMNSTIGWKMAQVPRITNDAWIINLRSTLT